jgi:hypothetical protein
MGVTLQRLRVDRRYVTLRRDDYDLIAYCGSLIRVRIHAGAYAIGYTRSTPGVVVFKLMRNGRSYLYHTVKAHDADGRKIVFAIPAEDML